MSIREDMINLALSIEGLTAPSDSYLDLLGPVPPETVVMRKGMATMSSCALTIRGMWRRLGLKHPILASHYIIGHAISDVVKIAHDAGAAVQPSLETLVPGNVIMVGMGQPNCHVFTLVADGVSIDGGQRDAHGNEQIQRIERTLVERNGVWYESRANRAVGLVVDVDALFSWNP